MVNSCYLGSIAFGRSLVYVSPPVYLAISMATDQSSTPNAVADRHLHGAVIFLLPCSNMSALRRSLLMAGIRSKGGAVTNDPGVASHCVIAIPLESATATRLLNQFCVPVNCTLVPESFLFQ